MAPGKLVSPVVDGALSAVDLTPGIEEKTVRRILSTDGDGGIVYEVPGKRRPRARYEQGPAVATESTQSGGGAKRNRRVTPPGAARSDGPAGQRGDGEALDDTVEFWPVYMVGPEDVA